MYRDKFVLSIIHDGYPVKEAGRFSNKEVAIPFGSEYKIRLKNKNDVSCTARVFIDGKKVSQLGDIIINGGGTIDLERYIDRSLDKGRRFKFVSLDHSDVDDPTSSSNGVIKVEFRKSKQNTINIQSDIYVWDKPFDNLPRYKEDNRGPSRRIGGKWKSSGPDWGASIAGSYSSNESTGGLVQESCTTCNFVQTRGLSDGAVESGATIEGSKSNQQFTYADLEVENHAVVLTLKIVGIGNLKKINNANYKYCTRCGQRIKRSDKYCSKCGHKS